MSIIGKVDVVGNLEPINCKEESIIGNLESLICKDYEKNTDKDGKDGDKKERWLCDARGNLERESLKYDDRRNFFKKKRVTVPLGQGWRSEPKE